MATKVSEREKTDQVAPEAPPTSDGPLLDLTDQAVRRMIKLAKKRGSITYDESTRCCRPARSIPTRSRTCSRSSPRWGSPSSMKTPRTPTRSEPGAKEEAGGDEEETEGGELVETAAPKAIVAAERATPGDRTDDPVRMYLREMGSVELLSREGEIAIAKRIEAGREAMIAGLCESPLTFQAIIIWRDELNDAKVLLRDIIDLEATYAGSRRQEPRGRCPRRKSRRRIAGSRAVHAARLRPRARCRRPPPPSDDGRR